jgi:unsaturated rhamnogalacturonyl hydrolase
MPQQALVIQGWRASRVDAKIVWLMENLVNLKDHGGKFLLRLKDGRFIDTKGWNDWEWSMVPETPQLQLM